MDRTASIFTSEFGKQVCDILSEETGYQVILTDENGCIVAATDHSRVGTIHEIAKRIMNGEFAEYAVSVAEAETMQGVRPGVNLPIVFQGARCANIGISGDPLEVRPLARVSARMVQLWLQNQELLNNVTNTSQAIYSSIQEISATIEEISASSEEIAAMNQMTHQTALDSTAKVENVEDILVSIKNLASQSKLIGLNAAIESARLGENGRAFGVIAQEIRKLAANSEESAGVVGKTLTEIVNVFKALTTKVDENQTISSEQSSALASVVERVVVIENAVSRLVEQLHSS